MIRYENIIGSERQTRTLTSTEITVGMIVTGIPSFVAAYAKMDYVINNLGFTYGDPHPDYTQAKLSRIDARALASDTAEIELTYTHYIGQTLISVTTSLSQIETNKYYKSPESDDTQELIQIAYKYPADYELDTGLRDKVIQKSPTLAKDSHDAIMTITREEDTSYVTIIGQITEFVNTVNSSTAWWTVDMRPLSRETWKCIDINGQYNNATGTYTKNYVFAYRPLLLKPDGTGWMSQWDIDVYYRDQQTGEPPADIKAYTTLVDGVPNPSPGGLKLSIPVYRRKNFNELIAI